MKINKSKINKKVGSNLAVVTLASPQMKRVLEGPLRSVDPKFRVTCCECKILLTVRQLVDEDPLLVTTFRPKVAPFLREHPCFVSKR